MFSKFSVLILLIAILQFINASVDKLHVEKLGQKVSAPTAWDYDYKDKCDHSCTVEDKCGPACWSDVVPAAGVTNQCAGTSQTPVNIVLAKVDKNLKFPELNNGVCDSWEQFSDDHAFEVNFHDAGCSNIGLTYKGISYSLYQFHFHTPAEHVFGGGSAEAELHMVHKSDDGKLLVLGVVIEQATSATDDHSFMRLFWKTAWDNQIKGTKNVYGDMYEVEHNPVAISPYQQFLPASRSYYTYTGSLTTYPCTEGVTWLVFEDTIFMSSRDIKKLRSAIANSAGTIIDTETKNDNRPVQELNGRVVTKFQG